MDKRIKVEHGDALTVYTSRFFREGAVQLEVQEGERSGFVHVNAEQLDALIEALTEARELIG